MKNLCFIQMAKVKESKSYKCFSKNNIFNFSWYSDFGIFGICPKKRPLSLMTVTVIVRCYQLTAEIE